MIFIILPDQLYYNIDLLHNYDTVFLIEDNLYFKKYNYSNGKILYHQITMKSYFEYLLYNNINVKYIHNKDSIELTQFIKKHSNISMYYPSSEYDYHLDYNKIKFIESDNFILTRNSISTLFKSDFMSFYIYIRENYIPWLQNKNGQPKGGEWSFDKHNRNGIHSLPNNIPILNNLHNDTEFNSNNNKFLLKLPWNHSDMKLMIKQFIKYKLNQFGPWQDVSSNNHITIFHSVLSAGLNIGLSSPMYIINEIKKYKNKYKLKNKSNLLTIENIESFIRQLIWREYIRYYYLKVKGYKHNSLDYILNKGHSLSNIWWNYNKSNIQFIDILVERTINNNYLHHIERLMLASIMLQLGISPNNTYKWFLTQFIDAYPWVMKPNIYSMIYHIKPDNYEYNLMKRYYLFSCNYYKKMTNFNINNEECDMFSALYYYFIYKNSNIFKHDYIYINHIKENTSSIDINKYNKLIKLLTN